MCSLSFPEKLEISCLLSSKAKNRTPRHERKNVEIGVPPSSPRKKKQNKTKTKHTKVLDVMKS